MQMVNNLQLTLQRKQDAVKNLRSKSKSLQKTLEPRGAYKFKINRGSDFDPSSPSMKSLSPLKSINSGDLTSAVKFKQNRGRSIAPQPAND
jgi:hypothetical protein